MTSLSLYVQVLMLIRKLYTTLCGTVLERRCAAVVDMTEANAAERASKIVVNHCVDEPVESVGKYCK